jgi:hypothetical protein
MFQTNTRHSVFFNEKGFILCLRHQGTLFLSQHYECASQSPHVCLSTMTHLAYFLAHAMSERFPSMDSYTPAAFPSVPTDTLSLNPSSIRDPGKPPSRGRTASETTITGRHSAAGLGLFKAAMAAGISCTFSPRRFATPSFLMFHTSGVTSPPLMLTPLTQCTSFRSGGLVGLSALLHQGERSAVFRGSIDGFSLIAKVFSTRAEGYLQTESAVYKRLASLQGQVIPRCFGTYKIEGFAFILLIEDCGISVRSFQHLSSPQRFVADKNCIECYS